MLIDQHGREVNYLRLAVTDRCNLRCFYCMPEEGIDFLSRKDLLSFEEMLRLCELLVSKGVTKIRITGGEPFLRKNLIYFLEKLSQIPGLEEWHLTTNGTLSTDIVAELKQLGIASVNLSLDSLDQERFLKITRRDLLPNVLETKPIDVRFIEEMPFNGSSREGMQHWDHIAILDYIKSEFPDIEKIKDPKYSTSANYQVPGYLGNVGIIAAYSRTFCGSCNRIRLTPKGILKTCLYDKGTFNIRDILRSGANDEQVLLAIQEAIRTKAVDGIVAEKGRSDNITESMASIGG